MKSTKKRLVLVLIMVAVCAFLSAPLVIAATLSNGTGVDAISLDYTGGSWTTDSGAIYGSISDKTNTTQTATLTINSALTGDSQGTLSFKYTYTLSASEGRTEYGAASITVNGGTPISVESKNSGYSANSTGAVEGSVTLENWAAGSSWTVKLSAEGGYYYRAAGIFWSEKKEYYESSAKIDITEISFTPYVTDEINFVPSQDASYTVQYYEDANATELSTVSVAKGAVENVPVTGELGKGMAIVGAENYYCVGVKYSYAADGTTISGVLPLDAAGKVYPEAGYVLTPLFAKDDDGDGIAPFQVDKVNYWTWETAMIAAAGLKTVVLTEDYTLPSTYVAQGMAGAGTYVTGTDGDLQFSIPDGVSLLVPYAATDTTIQTETKMVEGAVNSTYEHANMKLYSGLYGNEPTANVLLPDKEVTYTLTIPKETTVTVASGGKFVIGGTIVAGNVSNTGISGGTAGPHSNVQLEGTINVNGILSSCGYILGGGTVNVNGGGTLYQPFIIMDYINGQYVAASNEDKTFPFNRYAMMNVQSDLHVVAGGVIKGYVDLYTSTVSALGGLYTVKERHNVACVTIIGQENALVKLSSGTLDISYDPARYAKDDVHNAVGLYNRVGTTTMDFKGVASFESFSLSINVIGQDWNLNSGNDAFSIPYNYIINLGNPENGDGNYTITSRVRLMPGATMTVEKGATLNVNGVLVIMDGFRDHSAVATTVDPANWNNFHYPSAAVLENSDGINTGVANLIVNGTLNVANQGTFGGLVQTNGSGTIRMNGTAGVTDFKVGSPNMQKLMSMIDNPVTGRTLYNVKARVRNCQGAVIDMEQGKVYYGYSDAAYGAEDCSYRVYLQNNSDTTKELSIEIDSTVVGTWCVETLIEATEPTCTATGLTEGTHCPDCKKTFVEQIVVDALGHTWSAWSIDNATHTCTSACGNDSGHKISVLLEYRLNDYIWLNATVSSTAGNPVCSDASIAYEQYLIKKVLSNHITDSVKVSFTLNGATPQLDIGFPAYAALLKSYIPEVEEERTDAQKKLYNLLTAMEKYGTAADTYFDPDADTTTGIDFDDLTCPNKDGEIVRPGTHPMGLQHGALNSYAYGEQTYQLKSLGASFFFDECITLRMNYAMQGFDTSKLNTGDTIVQIGVLVGNQGDYLKLTGASELRADDGKYDLAYILYGAGSSGQDENYPNLPGYSGTEKDNPVTSLDSVDFDAMYVNFDLKAKEYTQQFALRPFVVIQHSDTTCTVLYGEQYLYGLENYVYNICTNIKYDSQEKILAFRNFLVRTWDYALAADAKYK